MTEEARDEGFTLVEMLVSMALFAVLGTVLLGFALGSSRVADDVTRAGNITGEARLAVERMTRELRQASEIYAATVTGGQAHQNMQPYLVLSFCVALQGIFPSRN